MKKKVKVSEMTIEQVIKLPLFVKNAENELKSISKERKMAYQNLKQDFKLKSHPIDFLQENGYLEVGKFILSYAKILDKKENYLTSQKRKFVLSVGNNIFTKTVQSLIDDEKKRDNRNRDGK